MIEKLKSFLHNDTYFTVCILLLVGIGSFGLGRLSATPLQTVEKPLETAQTFELTHVHAQDENKTEGVNTAVVASRSGSKYHLLDCPGAKQMSEQNKIFFDSVEEAKAAGYTAAGNCPGL